MSALPNVSLVALTLASQPAVAYPLHNVNTDEREEDQRHGDLHERVMFDVVIYLDLSKQPKEHQNGGDFILKERNRFMGQVRTTHISLLSYKVAKGHLKL